MKILVLIFALATAIYFITDANLPEIISSPSTLASPKAAKISVTEPEVYTPVAPATPVVEGGYFREVLTPAYRSLMGEIDFDLERAAQQARQVRGMLFSHPVSADRDAAIRFCYYVQKAGDDLAATRQQYASKSRLTSNAFGGAERTNDFFLGIEAQKWEARRAQYCASAKAEWARISTTAAHPEFTPLITRFERLSRSKLITGYVEQALDGGALVKFHGDLVYLAGCTGVIDNAAVEVWACPAGTYRYTNVLGAYRTVAKWLVVE